MAEVVSSSAPPQGEPPTGEPPADQPARRPAGRWRNLQPVSDRAQDLWFYVLFIASLAAVAVLFYPYRYVLLFASVLVLVTWPMYQWILKKLRDRRLLAALLSLLALCVGVFLPLIGLAQLAWREAAQLAKRGVDLLQGPQVASFAAKLKAWRFEVPSWAEPYVPQDPIDTIATTVRDTLGGLLDTATSTLPGLLGFTADAVIDGTLFVFAVLTLYMEGPQFLRFLGRLSPLDDSYNERLFEVFNRFAHNVVAASLFTAALQGLVAALGYGIAGVDRVVFLGIASGVCSFVPLVGTTLVWAPVALMVGFTDSWGWAIFIVAWSLGLTATVDNFAKPLFIRGASAIHPLAVFLSVFGGLAWMGLPGILLGPVAVAMFLALYTIHVEDFLGAGSPAAAAGSSGDVPSEPRAPSGSGEQEQDKPEGAVEATA